MTVSVRSPEDVVNLALTKIGAKQRVNNMYDGTPVSDAALNVYAQTRDRVLTEGNYRFARQDATLTAAKTAPTIPGGFGYVTTPWSDAYPPPPWVYEYNWPGDCLKVRSLKQAPLFLPNFSPQPVLFSLNTQYTSFFSGTIFFGENPHSGDTVTLNGVTYEFVPGTPGANQVQIGANTAFTIAQNLIEQTLDVSTDPSITVAVYDSTGGPDTITMTVTYGTPGPAGSTYTLAASRATVSAATLLGSTSANRTILCNSGPSVILTYVSQITDPNAWDAAFVDAFANALAPQLTVIVGDPKVLDYSTRDAGVAAVTAAQTQD